MTSTERRVETIITALEEAGWQRTAKSRTFGAADLGYRNDSMLIAVEYEEDDDVIYVDLRANESGDELTLMVRPADRLEVLLSMLIEFQDRVDETNYGDFVNAVVKACPDTSGLRDGTAMPLEAD
jgi:hypothetical protein